MADDIVISWSQLRSWTECQNKAKLQRAGKKSKMEDQRLFFPGTVTDRVVRNWLADDPYSNPGIMSDMVEETVNVEEAKILEKGKKLIWKDPEDKDNIIRECQKAVTNIEPSLNRLVLPYDYDVDFYFKAPIKLPGPFDDEPVVAYLLGYMDIIVKRGEGDWAVYDVKHTKNNDYWRKTRGQLSFYDTAVDLLFGSYTSEVGLLQPLCKEIEKMIPLGDEQRNILLSNAIGLVHSIIKKDFSLTDKPSMCYGCNVKHACIKFQPANAGKRVNLFGSEE